MKYEFKQVITNGSNSEFRQIYVRKWISNLPGFGKLLDVGAGPMPYRDQIKSQGLEYFSHDFEQYDGSDLNPGLQSPEWPIHGHDYVCDIENLNAIEFDYVICTEVLEHVPNPVIALQSIANTLKSGGIALITLPFSSRMHQSPFWFSSGLSRFWFEYHAPSCKMEISSIVIVGDFVDQMDSELRQLLPSLRVLGLPFGEVILRTIKIFRTKLRKSIPKELLESGGLGIYVELVKL